MNLVMLFKQRFEADKENQSLQREVSALKHTIAQIMKQYKSFGKLAPSTIEEAYSHMATLTPEQRTIFENNGFTLDSVDVVPRREYVMLVESYNRINSKYLELIEKIESEKTDKNEENPT